MSDPSTVDLQAELAAAREELAASIAALTGDTYLTVQANSANTTGKVTIFIDGWTANYNAV